MLIVFDLDFTLWDAGGTWCDHTTPPYRPRRAHILDSEDREIRLYHDVPGILNLLDSKGLPMALASRTHSLSIANTLLDIFEISGYFSFREIYPGSKIQHFSRLRKLTGLSYEDMYFFDDENRNISEVSELGVQAFLVRDGLCRSDLLGLPEIL